MCCASWVHARQCPVLLTPGRLARSYSSQEGPVATEKQTKSLGTSNIYVERSNIYLGTSNIYMLQVSHFINVQSLTSNAGRRDGASLDEAADAGDALAAELMGEYLSGVTWNCVVRVIILKTIGNTCNRK